MKATQTKGIFVLLVVLAVSLSACVEDHRMGSLVFRGAYTGFSPGIGHLFTVTVDHLDEKPVVEYGIVYTSYRFNEGPRNENPTVTDSKIVFNTPMKLGDNREVYKNSLYNDDPFSSGQIRFFYYRAYAIFNDGTVVYEKDSYLIVPPGPL
jgi:hypothetical protein